MGDTASSVCSACGDDATFFVFDTSTAGVYIVTDHAPRIDGVFFCQKHAPYQPKGSTKESSEALLLLRAVAEMDPITLDSYEDTVCFYCGQDDRYPHDDDCLWLRIRAAVAKNETVNDE